MSVLIIAGLDSSTGAGLARDLAVIADHGMTARVAATAVTAQDATGGCTVHPVPAAMVAAQIRAAGPLRAAKLGMLANASIVEAVAATLPDLPFVLDPVLATSAGAQVVAPGDLADWPIPAGRVVLCCSTGLRAWRGAQVLAARGATALALLADGQ